MKQILSILLIVFSLTGISQNITGRFTGGLTASQVSGDKSAKFNKIGFVIGPGAYIPFNDLMGISVDLIYIQKGSRKPITERNFTFYKLILNYVEVPFLFKYKFNQKVHFQLGPSFATLVKAQEEDAYGVIGAEIPFKRFEFTLQAGIDFILNEKLSSNIRFSNSIYYIREPQNQSRLARYWEKGQFITLLSLSLIYNF